MICFSKTPVKWHMQMRSKHNDTEVTTIFLQSEDPIFPSAVFINYGELMIVWYTLHLLVHIFSRSFAGLPR